MVLTSAYSHKRKFALGRDLRRQDREGLRLPGVSLRPGGAIRGQEYRLEFHRACDPALRARAGGGFRLLPVWVERATVGQVGKGGGS